MKRLAFLSSTIATLITPIQVQAQTNCVPFPQKPNPEAELRFLLSHPGARVCASQNPNLAGQTRTLQTISTQRANDTIRLMNAMIGRR
jgi:hypothetical protein